MVIGSYRAVAASTDPRRYICIAGLCSSVLNHGVQSRKFQVLDRVVITISAIVYTATLRDFEEFFLLYSAITWYFVSKVTGYSCFHVGAHLITILLHNKIY